MKLYQHFIKIRLKAINREFFNENFTKPEAICLRKEYKYMFTITSIIIYSILHLGILHDQILINRSPIKKGLFCVFMQNYILSHI